MFIQRIFREDFRTALEHELRGRGMSIRELSERAGVPAATIYKITSGERDPRFSTVRAIVKALSPEEEPFVAVIAARFLLEDVESETFTSGEITYTVRGYAANTMDECIIAAVRAEKDGAGGIICAPILADLIESLVDIPVVIVRPKTETFIDAIKNMARVVR